MGTVVGLTRSRLDFRVGRRYLAQLMDGVGRRTPQQPAEPDTVATVEACRSASFELAYLVNTVVIAVGAVVTALTSCASVWTSSPLSRVLLAARGRFAEIFADQT